MSAVWSLLRNSLAAKIILGGFVVFLLLTNTALINHLGHDSDAERKGLIQRARHIEEEEKQQQQQQQQAQLEQQQEEQEEQWRALTPAQRLEKLMSNNRHDGETYVAIYPLHERSSANTRGLVYYPKSYGSYDLCSDRDIAQYLTEEEPGGLNVFHFGTGGHHHVGLTNHARRLTSATTPDKIIGITASPAEFQSYIELCLEDGSLGTDYLVLFGDIYNLQPQVLPALDVASMPHLGEYYDPTRSIEYGLTVKGWNIDRSRYTAMNDTTLLELIARKLVPGGRLIIHVHSNGSELATEVLDDFVRVRKVFKYSRAYKTLAIYTKVKDP